MNNAEENDENDSKTTTTRVFRHLDNCRAVLEQVPETFDLGTVPVQLSCLAVSEAYIALGSKCGALFLFNRRIQKSVRPLRTNHSEVVTKIALFSNGEADYLAAGHQSGTLVLICLPSSVPGRNKKIRQSLQEDAHKGHAVTSLQWTHDGSKLFSADDSGLIVVTHVNFESNVFACSFVCCQDDSVLQIAYASSRLGFVTSRKCSLIDVADSCTTMIEVEMNPGNGTKSSPIGGICITGPSSDQQTMFVAEGGERISIFNGLNGGFSKTVDLKQDLENLSLRFCSFIVDGLESSQGLDVGSGFSSSDISPLLGRLQKLESHLVSHDTQNVVLIDIQSNSVASVYDLTTVLGDSEISDVAVDPAEGLIFVLTNDKRVLRLSDSPAPEFLTVAQETLKTSNLLQNGLVNSYKNASKLLFTAAPASSFLLNKLMTTVDERTLNIFSKENSSDENVERKNGEYPANIAHLIEQHKSAGRNDKRTNGGGLEHVITDEGGENPYPVQLVSESELVAVVEEQPPPENGAVKVQRRKGRRARRVIVPEKPPPASIVQHRNESEDNSLPSIDEEKIRKIHEVLGWTNDKENMPDERPSTSHDQNFEIAVEDKKPESKNPQMSPVFEIRMPTIDPKSLMEEDSEDNIEKLVETGYQKILKDLEMRKEHSKTPLLNLTHRKDEDSTSSNLQNSLNTIRDVQRIEDKTTIQIINDQVDIWNRIITPFSVATFSVCSGYMIVSSAKKKTRYRPLNSVHAPKNVDCAWASLKYSATSVALNDSASILWRIDKGIAYSPVDHDPETPAYASKWQIQANEGSGVLQAAITSQNAWYLTKDGIFVQMQLPDMGIIYRAECAWSVSQIAASESAVWAIRRDTGSLIIRAGLRHCPMGLDWVEAEPVGPSKLVSIALYDHSGWALDSLGQLWFTNGVDENNPFGTSTESWLQVYSPIENEPPNEVKKFLPIHDWTIQICSVGVFINVGPKIYVARSPLSGHVFRHIVPLKLRLNDCFMMIAAGGLCDRRKDYLYVCRPNSEVYMFNVKKRNFRSLPLFGEKPAAITSLCAAQGQLFALDALGQIHVRKGINFEMQPAGTGWEQMDLIHLRKEHYGSVLSIAVSAKSIWKLTSEGTIWTTKLEEIHWKRVDRPKQASNEKIDQVRVSTTGRFVWIFASASGRSWARTGVSSDFPTGRKWTEASNDTRVADIAVGENVVWALAQETNVLYRLRGLTAGNPAGNYWKSLPAKLRAISVDSAESRLWAIDLNNRIIRHETEIYPADIVGKMDKRTVAAAERDYEVI
ncbi:hypothetical protein L596_013638 [Steinernema carpocapsae]|uniref:Tectonin beta-propeller repeat-containing protein 2 n=1 Tax=Steinernema carpocapsae TaxID=34508 RepID=A0A4V6A558_STECR|nr:hypothetical protein L596_013638 [Steinernema carpocapsae]